MTKKTIVGGIALLVLGAIGGAILLNWMNSREEQFESNTDIAYAAAKRQLQAGQPSVDPFAKEHKAYPEFEEECELTALSILQYGGGPDKGKPIQAFELAGFVPAFDEYRIAIYKLVGASGSRTAVGCMTDDAFAWKGTRFLFTLPAR